MSEPTDTNLFDHITATYVGDAPIADESAPEMVEDSRSPLEIAKERIQQARGINPATGQKERKKRSTTTRAKAVPASKPGEFVEPMTDMYTWLGMGMSMFDFHSGHVETDSNGMPVAPCGVTIVKNAPKIAEAWDTLAQKNPAVRKALRGLTTTSIAGQLIMAHAPIAAAIIQGHVIGTRNEQPEYLTHDADIAGNEAKE